MVRRVGCVVISIVMLAAVASPAAAQCVPTTTPTSGTTVTCSGTSTTPVVAVTGSTGVTINVNPGASVSGSHVTAVPFPVLGVDQSSTITNNGTVNLSGGAGSGTNRGAAMLGNTNSNSLTNGTGATISTTGAFNDGMAANGSGNTLTNNGTITTTGPNAYGMSAAWGQTNVGQLNNTLINTGSVSTSGSSARAASILGGSGTINNSGALSTTGTGSTGAYLQGNNDQLINSGSINVSGAGSFAVDSNTVSSSFVASIQNTGSIISANGTGIRTLNGNTTITNAGTITGGGGTAISMGNGNDSLVLQTGSVINGTADGGAGTNTVTLQGTGTASNAFVNFQTLIMQGTSWNWTGSGTFASVQVQAGLLNVTGTLGASAAATVSAGATLQASSQSMPQSVTDNGTVVFNQTTNGTYAGTIGGTGVVTKNGAGVLTLTGVDTYSGGTNFNAGTVAVGADSTLGAPSGPLTFNGGTLQFTSSFNLSPARAIMLNAPGGTIDTQGFTTTIAQGMTGAGSLTKLGAGTLTLTGSNLYTGGTTISAGTLQLGNGGTSGSIVGDVTNNGTLAFNRSDILTFPGMISGSGSVSQIGTGTTILTGNNTYTGGTTISAGTLQLGNGGTSGSIVGDVANNGTLAFNRSDIFTFAGTISGIGSVNQIGTGTTILTANSTYTGGTTVAAGTLAVGDPTHPGAALSGGGPITIASGATLGGYGSVTGAVTNNGTVAAANALPAFGAGPNGTFTINGSLLNSGLVNLAGDIGNQLVVVGNYVGANGMLNINTVLAGDGSPSDKLVISGGTATGSTSIGVTNAGGGGTLTTGDGIQVVQAINGATTSSTAFHLAGPVSAGAFDYFLFKGGVSPGSQDSWFLRNSVVAGPGIEPIPAPGTPPLPAAVPGGAPIPLFRPEVAVQSVVPSVARTLMQITLGTFNERQGTQALLNDDAPSTGDLISAYAPTSPELAALVDNSAPARKVTSAAWGRVFGQNTREQFAQGIGVAPSFDGTYSGLQVGSDVWRFTSANGHRDHVGLYFGYAHASGGVHGFVNGFEGAPAGQVELDAQSVGGYWTHVGPSNWYIDTVVQGTKITGLPESDRGIGVNLRASDVAASIEGGYPIPLSPWLMIEPQVQGIWQRVSIDGTADQFSAIGFNSSDVFTGRVGGLLKGTLGSPGAFWQPYLKGNVWWGSTGADVQTGRGMLVQSKLSEHRLR